VAFETAVEVFNDPNQVVSENYYVQDQAEQRHQVIGMTHGLVLLLVSLWIAAMPKSKSSTSSRRGRQTSMRQEPTKIDPARIEKMREAYADRDRSLDRDPDAPIMPPEFWAGATIGKYYRPLKTQISLRVDNDVLDWLKSKGEGHLTRINEILRSQMVAELRAR
jgi:uncharacterized protein (DUF4415 family)